MSIEILLALISSVVIPLIGCAVWLAGRLARLEGEIKSLSEIKRYESETIDLRITRLEKHVHDIRNYIQAMALTVIKEKIRAKDSDDDSTSTFYPQL